MHAKTEARFRVLSRLDLAGSKGLTKTELYQYTHAPADELDLALQALANEFLIVACKDTRGFGRPKTRYWHKDHAQEALTESSKGDIPTRDPEAPLPEGGTCRRCGRATSAVLNDRPLTYCTSECRALDKSGGPRMADLLATVSDPRAFVQIAILLVMIDLISRGFRVALAAFQIGPDLLVCDDQGGLWLHVLPISQSGHFPPLEDYDSVAAVFRDGQIQYGGKNPLVVETEKSEDAQATE